MKVSCRGGAFQTERRNAKHLVSRATPTLTGKNDNLGSLATLAGAIIESRSLAVIFQLHEHVWSSIFPSGGSVLLANDVLLRRAASQLGLLMQDPVTTYRSHE